RREAAPPCASTAAAAGSSCCRSTAPRACCWRKHSLENESAAATSSVCSLPPTKPRPAGVWSLLISGRKRASPQPPGGGLGRGVTRDARALLHPTTPTPNPSPQGGGEHIEYWTTLRELHSWAEQRKPSTKI